MQFRVWTQVQNVSWKSHVFTLKLQLQGIQLYRLEYRRCRPKKLNIDDADIAEELRCIRVITLYIFSIVTFIVRQSITLFHLIVISPAFDSFA